MPKLVCDCGAESNLSDRDLRAAAGQPFTCRACGTTRNLPLPNVFAPSANPPKPPPVVFQPVSTPPEPPLRHLPRVGFECPFCHSRTPPRVKTKVTVAGWVLFVIFLFAFPVNLLALLLRDESRKGVSGGFKLGTGQMGRSTPSSWHSGAVWGLGRRGA